MTASRPSNKDKERAKKFRKSITGHLWIVFVIICVMLLLLLLRVYKIQKENKEDYDKIILSQRQSEYVSRNIPYRRGDIYDRNGNKLASSEKVYILILDPAQIKDYEGVGADGTKTRNVIDPTVSVLSEFFGLDQSMVRKTINDNPSSSYIRLKKDVSYDEKQQFLELVDQKNAEFQASKDPNESKNRIKGVWFEDNYKRTYPYGSFACNVIGFSSADGTTGTGGVEQYYNEKLIGTNGREYGYLNDEADLEKVIKSAENGDTLVLTIDANIQNIVEKYLDEWKNGDIGSKSAACVVMDPNNGEVLAMASTNDFDLNDPDELGEITEAELFELGIPAAVADYKEKHPELVGITKDQVQDYYTREEIINLGKLPAIYKNWRNICVSDTYEPGSTQKIFTVASALEEDIISKDASFECKGHVELSDGINRWRINCVNRNGHGIIDVKNGIMQSCNVAMMNIAFAEKSENFMKYEKLFGFGRLTGIDLPAEANTSELGFQTDDIGKTQLATNSFGQNYNCTMIQMASAYCSVINGGSYYRPHVLKQVLSPDGTIIENIEPVLVNETISKSTCDFIKEALVATVEEGTGKAAKVPGYTVGGKTGTAQKLPRSAQTYVVSFCGYAPAEDPKLLCYVIVDEPSLPGEEAAHSTFASQIFSKIMAEALPVMNVYPENMDGALYKTPTTLLPTEEGDSKTELGSEIQAENSENGSSENEGHEDIIDTVPHAADSEETLSENDQGLLPEGLAAMWDKGE